MRKAVKSSGEALADADRGHSRFLQDRGGPARSRHRAVRAAPADRGRGRAAGAARPCQGTSRSPPSSTMPPRADFIGDCARACARFCSTSSATRSSSPKPAASRSRSSAAPDGALTFRIRDTGIGIAPETAGPHLRGVRAGRRRRRPAVRRHRPRARDIEAPRRGDGRRDQRSTARPGTARPSPARSRCRRSNAADATPMHPQTSPIPPC